jgi:hypothetical protein
VTAAGDTATDAEILAARRRIMNAQAADQALWAPMTVMEGYYAQELRALHQAVEGDLTARAAVED